MNVTCREMTIRLDYRPSRVLLTCESQSFTEWENLRMTDVAAASAIPGFTTNKTEALTMQQNAANLTYMPTNFGFFFPNLTLLNIVGTRLRQLAPQDFAQFSKLKTFVGQSNEITTLPTNLFQANQEIEEFAIIGLTNFTRVNSLHTIGANMLINATKLEYVLLWYNFCVNEVALNRSQVVNLNSRLHIYCSSGYTTSTALPGNVPTTLPPSLNTTFGSTTQSRSTIRTTTSAASIIMNMNSIFFMGCLSLTSLTLILSKTIH